MKKKLIVGALIGAFVLIAAIMFAAPVYASEMSAKDANGDCDQTKDQLQDQDRDRLKDGSCDNCTCAAEGTAEGLMYMNQEAVQAEKAVMNCASNGDGPYGNCHQYMDRNGKA